MRHLAAMSVGALLLLVVAVAWYLGLLARSDRAQQAAVVMVDGVPKSNNINDIRKLHSDTGNTSSSWI